MTRWKREERIINDRFAQLPTVVKHDKDHLTLLYSSRDNDNRSYIAVSTISKYYPFKLKQHLKPLMKPSSKQGLFDSDGVMPSSVINFDGHNFLIYTGWQQLSETTYNQCIGIAEIDLDNLQIISRRQAPIIGTPGNHMRLCNSGWALLHEGIVHIWYCRLTEWIDNKPHYNIYLATSGNLSKWETGSSACINTIKGEAISRPCVTKEENKFRMWFSHFTAENPNYKLGYAESNSPSNNWIRKDASQIIDKSTEKWDNDMMCYPFFISHNKKDYLFYSGNNYGAEGIGYLSRLV